MEFEIKDYNNYNHEDILAYPEYQRNGIGTALLQKILDEYKNVYQKLNAGRFQNIFSVVEGI